MIKQSDERCDDICSGMGHQKVNSVKSHLIPQETAVELADLFKALGDPTRIKIIHSLLKGGELCVHDLCEVLEMAQSAVSHQLRYLRNLRIVKRRKEGKTVYYSLDDHHIEQIYTQTLQHITHL